MDWHSSVVRAFSTLVSCFISNSIKAGVDRRGVEPRLPGCKPSVFPLDEQPVVVSLCVDFFLKGPPGN